MRRVFRDYIVLLAAPRLTQAIYRDMLLPFKFARIEITHDDQQAIHLMKKFKPQLVVATMSLSVFTGPQLLTATRADPLTKKIPFLIIGVKEDLKAGGIAEHVQKADLADFVGLPVEQEQFVRTVVKLLDPLIDHRQEQAYELFDQAAALAQADKNGAIETYRRGLDLYDRNAEAWLAYAALLTEQGDYEHGEDAYFKVLRLNQYSFMAYLGLADLYERSEDYELTIGILKQAMGIARKLKVSDKSVSRINFFIGEFELRLKRLTQAAKAFDSAIEQAPQDAELRVDIGDAYAEKGYYAESEQHYQSAIELDPNLAHVFNRLGIAYRRQEKYQKALQLYDKARIHHPRDEHLLFNIARAHMEGIHHSKAQALLDEALAMAPSFKEAKLLMAKLRSAVKQTEIDLWDEEVTPQSVELSETH